MQRTFLPPLPSGVQRAVPLLVVLTLLSISVLVWIQSRKIDWLLLSGGIALLVGNHHVQAVPDRLERTLRRLRDRGVLRDAEPLEELAEHLESAVVQRWSPAGGALVAVGIALAFLGAFTFDQLLSRLPLLTAEIVGGYVAGCYLGRMACYGRLGDILKQRWCALRLMPGHPDGVGGWTPLGDFFFYQAALVAIPAGFLSVWLLLIQLTEFHDRYKYWSEPYGYLLALAIAFEIGAFLLPLWSFHRIMSAQKVELQVEADRLSVEIAELRRQLSESGEGTDRGILKETLAHLSERYWAIELLPEWPISPTTRRMFGFGNLGLLVPLISEQFGLSKEWADVIKNWIARGA